MSATRCRGTARASTGSSCAARRSCAGRCTATCSRRCARGGWRSGAGALLEPGVWITAPGAARVRIGAGTFLNMGVMVAAQELVEIGEHCMLANGCFVSDASHRYDDPEKPITWQGFESKGPTRIGDNCWLGAQRGRHQRRDDRRALRDRRQQRRHARHRAVLDRRRRAGAGAAAGRVAERRWVASGRWTCSRRCAARRRAAASSPIRCRARLLVRALDSARFAPSGGNRQGWRVVVVQDAERRAALRDLYLPRLARLHGADGRRAMLAEPEASSGPARVRMVRRADEYAERPGRGAGAPGGGRAPGRPRGHRRRAAAPEHRRRRVGVPVRAEPAARRCAPRVSAPR